MLYEVTAPTLAVRLSLKNPDKNFFPKWWIKGMDSEKYVAVHSMMPQQTIGLFLGTSEIRRIVKTGNFIDCVILLIEDQQYHIPKQCVAELSEF